MHKSFFSTKPETACVICLVGGLILGIISATNADASVASLMRLSVLAPVSIILLLSWSTVPFLIASYAVKIHKIAILYVLLAIRHFAFGFAIQLCFQAFYHAAWLVCPMLLFAQWLTLIALNMCSMRWLCGRTLHMKRDLLFCVIFIIFVAIIDLYAVSPFLAELMNS